MPDRAYTSLIANSAAVSASVISGSAVVVTSLVVHEANAATLAFYRYLVAAVIVMPLMPFVRPSRKVPNIDLFKILLLGWIFFAVFPWTFNIALAHTTATRASVAIATLPVQTLVIAWALGLEKVSGQKLLGVLLGAAGVAVVFIPDVYRDGAHNYFVGDLVMLFTVFCGAVYFVTSRPIIERYGAPYVTFLAMLFGVLGLTLLAIGSDPSAVSSYLSVGGWVGILYLGSIAGVGQFLLYGWSMKYLASTQTALYVAITPLSALVLGYFVLRDDISALLIVGLILVLTGIALNEKANQH